MDIMTVRHSLSHILASAVLEIRPDTKLAIGPAIDNGFYYDFKFSREFSSNELKELERKMKKIIKRKIPFERYDMSVAEAIKYYKKEGNEFKLELIKELKDAGETKVSFYRMGDFVDLCRGPHVETTGDIPQNIFKIDRLAGAYWRGDENRDMLTRIYGLAFETPEALDDYIEKREEAFKRDHRKLGAELELFSTHDEIGAGLICWHPKGARVRSIIEDFWKKEHFSNNYDLIYTPHIGRSMLWETSGHLDFYSENMYSPIDVDKVNYYIRPMNCPFHIMIYKSKKHSYRDLPLRWAELGTVYRYERSGVLHGLMRVRGFTQDDAHIICTPEQMESEIIEVLRFSLRMWDAFGFKDVKAYVSTKPDKSVGDDAEWEKAIASIEKAVTGENIDYEIEEGGGVFYGPKIDLKIKDALDRQWQTTTIQFDFNLPERFDLTYIDQEGKERRPFMIHRALLGSLERFFGVLIEHYGGAFPLWLAPVQIRLITVADRHIDFVRKLEERLKQNNIRAEIDVRNESVSKKIREGRLQRIPYLAVIGDKEIENGKVMIRNRDTQEQNSVTIEKLIEIMTEEDIIRSLDLSI